MLRFFLRASAALSVLAPLSAGAATYTVTNTNDAGAGSLRAALQNAVGNPGFDSIVFNIPGVGEKVISPLSQLPSGGTGAIYIDGFSQPGFAGAPLIRLDGVNLPDNASGLVIGVASSTVRGLKFTRFGSGIVIYGDNAAIYGNWFGTDGTVALPNGAGIRLLANGAAIGGTLATSRNVFSGNDTGIYLDPGFSNTGIVNNYFGLNPAGTAALPNTYAGIRSFADSVTIGGTLAAQRNVISGNARYGISIDGGQFATIVNNYVGTNAAGTAAVPNDVGIQIAQGASHDVGGVNAGEGNLVSGNTDTGIVVGGGASFVTVAGNRVGTNLAGNAALPNGQYGVQVHGQDVDVGGFQADALNVISGNGRDGLTISASAERVFVLNNRIGTNLAGTASIPNAEFGISAAGTDITIGLSPNVISGNGASGIAVIDADGMDILNNRIGTNLAGTAALPNESYGIRVIAGSGVRIGLPNFGNLVSGNARGMSLESDAGVIVQANNFGLTLDETAVLGNADGLDLASDNNVFGGTGAGQGNVVAGNDGGLTISAGGAHNVVQGNFLGSNRNGTFVPGNGYASMYVYEGFDNLIGGTEPGAGNVIAGNYAAGIFTRVGKRNSFLGNSIHSNELGGIDSEPIGPSPNDPLDADQGPNENQNRPVVRSAVASNNQIAILGDLHSTPVTPFRVEFFHNDSCHESGLGEGRTFLGALDVVTQADGDAELSTAIASNLASGFVTATATSNDGNTSEFSPCIAIGAPGNGKFSFWRDPGLSYEDLKKVEIFVVRSEGLEGTVSVNFATVPDSATAPADYTHTTKTLTFGPGEWLRSVTVPLVLDNDVEGDQEFKVTLANPTGGATIATPQATYILFDHEQIYPFAVVSNVSLDEPAAGQAIAMFEVSMTSTDHEIIVDYETVAETATAGVDFEPKSGSLTFPPSATTTTLQVPVIVYADAAAESDETFRLDVHGNSGDFIAAETVGEAIIRDDSAPLGRIFGDGFE